MDLTEPPPEAYERVTNPERFRALHPAARELLDRLAREYAVERRDHVTADPAGGDAQVPATQLVPVIPEAGQLTVVFFEFPALTVTMGRWYRNTLPACGCDACAEEPEDLVEELHDHVDALVSGGFTERLTRGWEPAVSWEITTERVRQGSWTALSRDEARQEQAAAGRIRWAPWPPATG